MYKAQREKYQNTRQQLEKIGQLSKLQLTSFTHHPQFKTTNNAFSALVK